MGPTTFSGFAVSSTSFTIDSTKTTCSTTTPLAAQATCTVEIIFAPKSTGALTGTLTVTDNSLNATTTTQLIPLVGTGGGFGVADGDEYGAGGECYERDGGYERYVYRER